MSTRSISMSWEFLADICSEGARLTWPGNEANEAVCVAGLSKGAAVDRVILNSNRTITIVVNDPHYDGPADALPAWRLQKKERPS